jgi:predicted porin
MKRNLIALAVVAAVAVPLNAQAAPKVYGKLNLSAESYKKHVDNIKTDEEYTRLQSNASRFGAKGEDELTADLSAVYGIEWQVAAEGDDVSGLTATTTTTGTDSTGAAIKAASTSTISGGNKLDLTQRNRFVGIKSQKFGTVKLGKYDTYTKLAQGEIDLFNDFLGDMQYVIAGENRVNNVIGYESPKLFDALTINVMSQTQDSTKPTNGNSVSVVYNNEEMGIYAALAMDSNITGATALSGTRESDNVRLVGSYKIADLTLNAIYNTNEASAVATGVNANKENAWQLGAGYKIGDELLKVQFGEVKADNAKAASQKRNQWSIGADHSLTSKTKAFAWYTEQKEDKKAEN